MKLYGDAWTWWDQAAGKFPREAAPEIGSVMVLAGYSGPKSGHVAVVRAVASPREIRVDHANWLDDGAIYVDDPVADVSSANDWSEVRVWNIKTGGLGWKILSRARLHRPGRRRDHRPHRPSRHPAPGRMKADRSNSLAILSAWPGDLNRARRKAYFPAPAGQPPQLEAFSTEKLSSP